MKKNLIVFSIALLGAFVGVAAIAGISHATDNNISQVLVSGTAPTDSIYITQNIVGGVSKFYDSQTGATCYYSTTRMATQDVLAISCIPNTARPVLH